MIIKSKCGKYDIIIDDEDYQRVVDFAPNGWEIKFYKQSNNPYVITRKTITIDGKRIVKQYFLHRFIMNVLDEPKKIVDHIKTKTLDNRKSKLRVVSHYENMKNRTSSKNSKSKYLGVSINNNKFRAGIRDMLISKNNIHLGYYHDEESAGYAYNLAANIIHGKFANLNEINIKLINNINDIEAYILTKLKSLNILNENN